MAVDSPEEAEEVVVAAAGKPLPVYPISPGIPATPDIPGIPVNPDFPGIPVSPSSPFFSAHLLPFAGLPPAPLA